MEYGRTVLVPSTMFSLTQRHSLDRWTVLNQLPWAVAAACEAREWVADRVRREEAAGLGDGTASNLGKVAHDGAKLAPAEDVARVVDLDRGR